MEFGNDTTLFYSGDKDQLTNIVVEEDKNKPYWEENNPWRPNNPLLLMTDEDFAQYFEASSKNLKKNKKKWESENEETKRTIRRIFNLGEKLDGFSPEKINPLHEKTLTARGAAIAYENVNVMSFPGQETIISEYLGDQPEHKVWEFEPHPDLELVIGRKHDWKNWAWLSEIMLNSDENKLWQILENKVKESNERYEVNLDVRNLTPYEAVSLVGKVISERMNYEYLITHHDTTMMVDEAKAGNGKTSRKDLLEVADIDPKKFNVEVANLEKKIDKMSVDELLEYRYGVCRHLAAVSQKLYEVLRRRQDGLLMNGSYLVYHDEGIGRQVEMNLVENHAYNILVVTSPGGKDGEAKISMTVVDPTAKVTASRFDHTYKRISQAISFLEVNGEDLGVKDKDEVCRRLASEAMERIRKYMMMNDTTEQFNDYAALLIQSGLEKEKVVEELKRVFMAIDGDEIDFLNKAFSVPVLSYPYDFQNNRFIREQFLLQIVNEITKIDFNENYWKGESLEILKGKLDTNVSAIHLDSITSLKSVKHGERYKMSEVDGGYLDMINELMRLCVELNLQPSEKALKVISLAATVEKDEKFGHINWELAEKLQQMVVENGTK